MREKNGITLLALTITIIILLLLVGVALSILSDGGILKNANNVAEQTRIEKMKSEIEEIIVKKWTSSTREITIDQIIEELENKGLITSENGNPDNGQVKTQPDGYVYEIKEKSDGKWEVKYIGQGEIDKSAITISVTGNTAKLTNKVTLKIKGSSLAGITKYTPGVGTEKTYASKTTKIEETCEITANGTYTFTIENIKGKTASKTITINNIAEGEIQIAANPTKLTNGNVTVTVTWPSGTSTATKQISTNGGTSWSTYTGNTSTVTVSNNCTVKARVVSGTEEIKTATITINNIDKTPPTAPQITGGSTTYATSRTISISKEPKEEESGIDYYEYYLSSSSTAPTTATTATGKLGNTSETKSKTFNTNYAGYYVYYRAIDKAGNIGAWSTAQRLYIDVNTPTVTAKQTSVTITEGDSNSISSYFTVAQNGNAGISKTEYIDTSKSNAAVTNTNTLAVGTHVIKCTATKTTGTTANATMTIVVKSALPEEKTILWSATKNSETGSFAIPTGVNIIELSWHCADPNVQTGQTVVKLANSNTGTEITCGGRYSQGVVAVYIKVNPGVTYNVKFATTAGGAVFSYSRSINTQTPDQDLTN